MATLSPLNPQRKMTGCGNRYPPFVVMGFVAIILVNVIGNFTRDMEWKKESVEIGQFAQQAIEAGDYETVFSLVEPHESRNGAELIALLSKAQVLRREAQQRARQEKIVALVA